MKTSAQKTTKSKKIFTDTHIFSAVQLTSKNLFIPLITPSPFKIFFSQALPNIFFYVNKRIYRVFLRFPKQTRGDMDIYAITTQEVLDRIARHCPRAMSTYFHCINRCNDDGSVYFSKTQVEVDMSESWKSFLNRVKELARECVLEWHPLDKGVQIIMAPEVWENDN